MRGEKRSKSDLSSCEPFITNAEMGKTKSVNNINLSPNAPAIPCGLIAKTFFNGKKFLNILKNYYCKILFIIINNITYLFS